MSKVLFKTEATNTKIIDTTISFEKQIERMITYLNGEKANRQGTIIELTQQSIKSKVEGIHSCVKHAGPCDFSQAWIHKVNNELKAKGRSPKTAMVYAYAMQDFYEANGHPGFKFVRPKLTTKEAVYHSDAEVQRIIKYAGNDRDEAIITCIYYGALRNKELRYLHVDDIDLRNRVIHVRDHGQGIKGKSERDIPIPSRAIPSINKWLTVRNSIPELRELPYMFPSQTGQLLTLQGLSRIVIDAGKRAKVKTHPHALRHTMCSYLVNSGKIPITQVQKILGHKSLLTTQGYSHADLNQISASIDNVWS